MGWLNLLIDDPNHMRKSLSLFATIAVIFLVGCQQDQPLQNLSDYELVDRHQECVARKPTAPGNILACENIQRECTRRHQELGNYLCEG